MKLIDKDAVVAEIDKKIEYLSPYLGACAGQVAATAANKIAAYAAVKEIMDSLEVKEWDNVWHDAKEQPEMYRKYLARYSDGRVNGSWERHDDGFIPWKDVVKEHKLTHWCYVEDLLKL